MKFLHTADWHVGKVLRGRSRADEHAAVLRELVELARAEDVDAVIVAGDVFDTAAPTPPSQALVMQTLMALREGGREVVVLAGNHDDPRLLDVYRPVLGTLGVHVVGRFRRPADGGVVSWTTRAGEDVRLAAMPFLSHRYVVRAVEALSDTPDQHNRSYADRFAHLARALTAGFGDDTVNLVAAHGTLPGGKMGGGEREAQTIFSYYFEATAFPPTTQYAALGHLHRRQQMPGPCPIWYSGAPIAVDFGEEANTPGALLVTVEPGRPAQVREVAFGGARELRTVRGSLDELAARAEEFGDAWLRVVVAEKPRAGLADRVREILPNALTVDIDEDFRPTTATRRATTAEGAPRTPRDLFRDYLAQSGRSDERVVALFDRLYDEITEAGGGEG
ncbi:exonuclease SbcCD subunit D [Thermomonospora cellulosilytica]|uniref:Nuclease SbcCD subunit D n=1 Tax=Thermomonospora cellulosilytica TaxID=1411118 RepID=A0A7W3MZK4_9ACTN|nr:exonuclease SbcCD subunit D [Thermomonospora cellulosilytica]MBA9004803.1 exonuclease SbcD [Thermomonospora cellulosilytica]